MLSAGVRVVVIEIEQLGQAFLEVEGKEVAGFYGLLLSGVEVKVLLVRSYVTLQAMKYD